MMKAVFMMTPSVPTSQNCVKQRMAQPMRKEKPRMMQSLTASFTGA